MDAPVEDRRIVTGPGATSPARARTDSAVRPADNAVRRSTTAAGRTSRPTAAATGACGSSSASSLSACLPNSSPTTSPLVASYKGELLFPVLVDYPEAKFGGFLAVTDYKDPVIYDEIKQHGWMLWPPIRYSYSSINKDYPAPQDAPTAPASAFPSPPPWATRRRALRRAARSGRPLRGALEPQLARHRRPGPRRRRPPHLRLPHFGPVRPDPDRAVVDHRHRRRRGAGLLRRQGRPDLPALPRDLVVDPASLRADHHLLRPGPGLLDAARSSCCCSSGSALVGVVRAEFLRGRNFEYITAARALGLSERQDHVQASAAERHGRDADLPAVQAVRLHHGTDRARLPRPRPAARLAVARRTAAQGKNNLQAPWLGLDGVLLDRHPAVAC